VSAGGLRNLVSLLDSLLRPSGRTLAPGDLDAVEAAVRWTAMVSVDLHRQPEVGSHAPAPGPIDRGGCAACGGVDRASESRNRTNEGVSTSFDGGVSLRFNAQKVLVNHMESPACCRALQQELDKSNARLPRMREAVKLLKVSAPPRALLEDGTTSVTLCWRWLVQVTLAERNTEIEELRELRAFWEEQVRTPTIPTLLQRTGRVSGWPACAKTRRSNTRPSAVARAQSAKGQEDLAAAKERAEQAEEEAEEARRRLERAESHAQADPQALEEALTARRVRSSRSNPDVVGLNSRARGAAEGAGTSQC
jgi:hypothetical protein